MKSGGELALVDVVVPTTIGATDGEDEDEDRLDEEDCSTLTTIGVVERGDVVDVDDVVRGVVCEVDVDGVFDGVILVLGVLRSVVLVVVCVVTGATVILLGVEDDVVPTTTGWNSCDVVDRDAEDDCGVEEDVPGALLGLFVSSSSSSSVTATVTTAREVEVADDEAAARTTGAKVGVVGIIFKTCMVVTVAAGVSESVSKRVRLTAREYERVFACMNVLLVTQYDAL